MRRKTKQMGRKMSKTELTRDVEALDAEKKAAIEALEAKFAKKRTALTHNNQQDHKESFGRYLVGKGTKCKVKWKEHVGCDNYSPKKDWKKVTIDDWGWRTVSYDAGYGDCDKNRMTLTRSHFLMCPVCKHLVYDSSRKTEILQEGPSVCRCESDEAHRAANIFTQLPAVEQIKYPIVTVED